MAFTARHGFRRRPAATGTSRSATSPRRWYLSALALSVVAALLSPASVSADYHEGALATLRVTPSNSCDRRLLTARGTGFSPDGTSSNIELRLDRRDGPSMASISPRKTFAVDFLMLSGTSPGDHIIIATQVVDTGAPAPGTPARANVVVTESPTVCAGDPPTASEEEWRLRRTVEIYANDQACGVPLYHYTGAQAQSDIVLGRSIIASPTYTGKDGFTHPAGAYTTTIPPLPPFTRTQLQDLYKLGDRNWDVSRFVLICSDLNPRFFPSGYESEWYAPAIAGEPVPIVISLVGVNLMQP